MPRTMHIALRNMNTVHSHKCLISTAQFCMQGLILAFLFFYITGSSFQNGSEALPVVHATRFESKTSTRKEKCSNPSNKRRCETYGSHVAWYMQGSKWTGTAFRFFFLATGTPFRFISLWRSGVFFGYRNPIPTQRY
jgi:hypothetical protein